MRQDRYIHSVQLNPMAESIHSLGSRGRELAIRLGWPNRIKLERKPPRNLEHFLGINDIRIAVLRSAEDQNLGLDFFFASWELAQRGWTYSLIPDAVCCWRTGKKRETIAFEYDRGEERPGYIVHQKFRRYQRGFDGFTVSQVVMVVDVSARQERLQKYTAEHLPGSELFSFVVLDELLRCRNIQARISNLIQTSRPSGGLERLYS